MILRNPLCSQYFSPQVMLARYATNAATIFWSLIVLSRPNALLTAGSSYSWIVTYLDENWIAGFLLALAMVQITWLILDRRPLRYGAWGHGLLAFFWGFIGLSIYFNAAIMYPTPGALTPVLFGLAFYAFVSIPRVRVDALA